MDSTKINDEIQPFVVYRIDGQYLECALWQFSEGMRGIALFLSSDSATNYRDTAQLGPEWKVLQPSRTALIELLKHAHETGLRYAVLDPDLEKAKRAFDLSAIMANLGT